MSRIKELIDDLYINLQIESIVHEVNWLQHDCATLSGKFQNRTMGLPAYTEKEIEWEKNRNLIMELSGIDLFLKSVCGN